MSGNLCLQWNNHAPAFMNNINQIQLKEKYSDATIACQGKYFLVHRIVLATCSEYFDEIFERIKCPHPYIVFKDILPGEMELLLNYMYQGEVNVVQEQLPSLIRAAEALKIKGLAVPDEPDTNEKSSRAKKKSVELSNKRSDRESDNASPPEEKKKKKKREIVPSQTEMEFVDIKCEPVELDPIELPPSEVGSSLAEEFSCSSNVQKEDSNSLLYAGQEQSTLFEEQQEVKPPNYDQLWVNSISTNLMGLTPHMAFSPPSSLSQAQEPPEASRPTIHFSSRAPSPLSLAVPSPAEPSSQASGISPGEHILEGDIEGTSLGGRGVRRLAKSASQGPQSPWPDNARHYCVFCPYCSHNASNLKRHIMSKHRREKPFSCTLCHRAFSQLVHLQQHTRSHAGIKPFQCKRCFAKFSRKNTLTSHLAKGTCVVRILGIE